MSNPMSYDRPPPAFYIHVWPEAPYFIIFFFAFSHRNLFGTFEQLTGRIIGGHSLYTWPGYYNESLRRRVAKLMENA